MSLWWQLCAPWFRLHKWRVLLCFMVAFSTVLGGVGLLSVAGWFLTAAFLSGSTLLFNLFVPSALVRGLSMWRIASRYIERVIGHTVTLDLQAEIRAQTFEQLAMLPPAELARYRDGDLVARLINDVERLDSVFLLVIVPLVTAIAGGGLYALLVGTYIPWAGVAVGASVLMGTLWTPYWVAKKSANAGSAVTTRLSALRTVLQEAMVAQVDLTVFNGLERLLQDFRDQSAELSVQRSRMAAMASVGNVVQQLCMGLLLIAMVLAGYYVYEQHELSAAIWIGLLLGALGLFEIMSPLLRGAAGLGVASSAAKRLQALAARKNEITAPLVGELPQSGALRLEHVAIGYEAHSPIIKDVNLVVEQGERLLIRGLSGVGKTTLLHTIMGVIPSLQGQIVYGGTAINRVSTAQCFKRFALLSQHSTVFMGSIRHNLLLAKPNASDSELWAALERVRLSRFVHDLPGKLEGWVGEGGNTLSTGQQRRLCLARLLLSSASVWVLDEPLSGLDAKTAEALLHDLLGFAHRLTIIMVSHEPIAEGLFDYEMHIAEERIRLIRS